MLIWTKLKVGGEGTWRHRVVQEGVIQKSKRAEFWQRGGDWDEDTQKARDRRTLWFVSMTRRNHSSATPPEADRVMDEGSRWSVLWSSMRNKCYLEAVLAREPSSQAPANVTGPRLVKSAIHGQIPSFEEMSDHEKRHILVTIFLQQIQSSLRTL